MSLIPDLSDIPELVPVAEGEYSLRVTTAKETVAKTGRKGIMLVCDILDEDTAQNVIETMWLPMDSDDDTKKQTMYRMLKERLTAFGLPTDGTDVADFQGLEFSAILEYESNEDYGDRNNVKKIT